MTQLTRNAIGTFLTVVSAADWARAWLSFDVARVKSDATVDADDESGSRRVAEPLEPDQSHRPDIRSPEPLVDRAVVERLG